MIPRSFLAALVLASSTLAAGPALTTIQDVLYKADGTRFNGSLSISWSSFQAADNSTIVTQSTTVKVLDGVLRVRLTPTTTANPPVNYSVSYASDGRVQFQEVWSVPASAQPLRVRDVRVTSSSIPAAGPDTTGSPVTESGVVGLIADLGARPLKGAGYAAGRAAVVDATGMLVSATGADSDCVHVDGSSGPCGGGALTFVDAQALTGIVDGSNTSFGLEGVPNPSSSLTVYRNGILQESGQDFTLTGTTVQFLEAATPQPGDTLLAGYRTAGSESSALSPFSGVQVLCSGSGASTSSVSLSNLGNCAIPAGLLQAGDRIEIRFDAAHGGTASGFSVEADWGGTVLMHRDAGAGDNLVTGRGDAVVLPDGAQLSAQSWGTVLQPSATVTRATDAYAAGLAIAFLGKVNQSGDSVTLSNFTVVRIP